MVAGTLAYVKLWKSAAESPRVPFSVPCSIGYLRSVLSSQEEAEKKAEELRNSCEEALKEKAKLSAKLEAATSEVALVKEELEDRVEAFKATQAELDRLQARPSLPTSTCWRFLTTHANVTLPCP